MVSRELQKSQSESAGGAFWLGVRDQLPIQVGVVPFGLIFGAVATAAGLTPLNAQAFSLLIFAGSAQFVAASLVAQGAAPLVIVATILIINLRHALYSATMAPYYARFPPRWKAALAWLLTDEAFITTSIHARRGGGETLRWYALGAGLTLWAVWQTSTALGTFLGASLPAAWNLDFALPLTFLALLTPTLVDRPSLAAAVSAAVLGLLLRGLPFNLGLAVAVGGGILVGVTVDRARTPDAPRDASAT